VGCAYGLRETLQTHQVSRCIGRLLVVIALTFCASGCSFYAAGRTLIDYPVETLECFPACPSDTEPITLRHPVAGTLVECGPYPYAVSSSMAAVYRTERRQCVERYQRQGYVRLARAEDKGGR